MINAKSEMHNCRCYYLIRKAKRFFRLLFLFLENKRIFDEYNKISFMEIAIIIVESIITLAIYWFSGILKLSMMPYNWGSRDGSGILLWFLTAIPFFLLLITPMIAAYITQNPKILLIGSIVAFFLNWFVPFCLVNFNYFSDIKTTKSEWALYVAMPFIYGACGYIIMKIGSYFMK